MIKRAGNAVWAPSVGPCFSNVMDKSKAPQKNSSKGKNNNATIFRLILFFNHWISYHMSNYNQNALFAAVSQLSL